ncbi:hypothetical protein [Deinococcus peraridilitoris]|uniref:Uncharacterized protein n=1 Tax=Deinococcus peraridilitoris (strain DSM 19664 / LMG 22246 / CIP 109416 / KR-200) TaxID=937777 RepID=L0A1E5_DEIPD|nr:hypothetical protein [Deinococcus peraridilitoris]AFZ67002.1 hypothetical protein Deipe_1461 [Deinococcus peraridilitoris DSM 19664]
MTKRFHLIRDEDVSGSSGTGTVVEGVIFTDGRVAMRWLVPPCSNAFYDSISDVEQIHGHNGRTRIVFVDPCPDCGEKRTSHGPGTTVCTSCKARRGRPVPSTPLR